MSSPEDEVREIAERLVGDMPSPSGPEFKEKYVKRAERHIREAQRLATERAEREGWIRAEGNPPPPVGDSRKLVWLRDADGMEWWGVRSYHHGEGFWMVNGSREESATVIYWKHGPTSPHYPAPPTEGQ